MNRPRINTVTTTTMVYEIKVFLLGQDTFFSSNQTSLKKMRIFTTIFRTNFAKLNFLDGLGAGFCSTFATLLIFLFLGFFFISFRKKWQGWRDSNPQQPVLETGALPIGATALHATLTACHYLVSLCTVCLLHHLQYLFISSLSGSFRLFFFVE